MVGLDRCFAAMTAAAVLSVLALAPAALAQYADTPEYGESSSRAARYSGYDDSGANEIHGAGSDPGGVHGFVSESSRLGEENPRAPLGTEEPMERRPFKLPNVEVPPSDYDDVVSLTDVFQAEPGTAVRFPKRPSEAGRIAPAPGSEPRTISGLFSVRNKYQRTFDIDGSAGVFVAPRDENLYRLDGQQVTITLDENGGIADITPEVAVD